MEIRIILQIMNQTRESINEKQRTREKKSNRTHMMKRGEIIMSTMTITQFKITIKTKCTRISNNHMDI